MPSVRIETNVTLNRDTKETISNLVARSINEEKGDPLQNVSVVIVDGLFQSFGPDSSAPAAIVHLHTLEMSAEITNALTVRFSRTLTEAAGISAAKCYIFFHEVLEPRLIGWRGRTAAESARIGRDMIGRPETAVGLAKGRLVHEPQPATSGPPLSCFALELWDADVNGRGTFLASGATDPEGNFVLHYVPASSRFGDLPDLVLRVYMPEQRVRQGDREVPVRYLVHAQAAPLNTGLAGYDFGEIRVPYYEYGVTLPFPYTQPGTGRLAFTGGAALAFERASAKSGPLRRKATETMPPMNPTQVQDLFTRAYGPNLTISEEAREPGCTRTASWFGDRVLNGFGPQLLKYNPATREYRLDYNFGAFEVDGNFDLPNFRCYFEVRDSSFSATRIDLQWRQNGQTGKNPAVGPWTTYSPGHAQWAQALRVVRGNYFHCVCQVKGHVGQAHFNLEQYAIAFFRNIVLNPIQSLLFPFLREVVQINSNGERTLINENTGALPDNQPIAITSVVEWLRETLGEHDWKGFRPRQSICASHRYAAVAGQYWMHLEAYVGDWFSEHGDAVERHWDEIRKLSDDLVSHSVPARRIPITDEPGDDGFVWSDLNERPDFSDNRPQAVSPITNTDAPDSGERRALQQLCCYIIYQSSFFHSWYHQEMIADLGETRFASVLRNGSMGDEADDNVLPGTMTNVVTLATLHTIDDFDYGFMLRDEDGDLPKPLLDRLRGDPFFAPPHHSLARLRSRMNG
jgi:hypothetical protein